MIKSLLVAASLLTVSSLATAGVNPGAPTEALQAQVAAGQNVLQLQIDSNNDHNPLSAFRRAQAAYYATYGRDGGYIAAQIARAQEVLTERAAQEQAGVDLTGLQYGNVSSEELLYTNTFAFDTDQNNQLFTSRDQVFTFAAWQSNHTGAQCSITQDPQQRSTPTRVVRQATRSDGTIVEFYVTQFRDTWTSSIQCVYSGEAPTGDGLATLNAKLEANNEWIDRVLPGLPTNQVERDLLNQWRDAQGEIEAQKRAVTAKIAKMQNFRDVQAFLPSSEVGLRARFADAITGWINR